MVVNQVAETISRINKIEDFTRQQDYIHRSAEMLKIEESGLHALVNKFIREKVGKQENRAPQVDTTYYEDQAIQQGIEDDSFNLLNKDELQERALVRCLLDFGLRPWDENKRVADYIFEEMLDQPIIENDQLMRIVDHYKTWYEAGLEPNAKNFLYHEDQQLSALVVSIIDYPYELSTNWGEHYDGKIFTREELYVEDVQSTLNYLKLRKIKKLIEENQRDLERQHNTDEQLVLLQTHQHLKQLEIVLTQRLGTVILK